MLLRFCNEKFWNRLTNMVNALTREEIIKSMPKAHGVAEEDSAGGFTLME